MRARTVSKASAHLRLLVRALAIFGLLSSVACFDFDAEAPGTSLSGGSGEVGGGGGDTGAATRVYTARWNPSASVAVSGYALSYGTRSGQYDTTIDIPVVAAEKLANNIYAYDLTLDAERDHFMVLRAYRGDELSPPSNEITVLATVTPESSGLGAATKTASTDAPAPAPLAATRGDDVLAGTATPASAATTPDVTPTEAPAATTTPDTADTLAALDLDGQGEHLQSSLPSALGTADQMSLSMWIRPLLDDVESRVIADLSAADGGLANRVTLSIEAGGDLALIMHDAEGQRRQEARFVAPLAHDVWQHVAVVFDRTIDLTPRVYVDAELLVPASGAWSDSAWTSGDVLRIATLGAASTADGRDSFAGRLGHAALFASALDSGEIAEMHAAGHALDLRAASADYVSADTLLHYWRLAENVGRVGADAVNGAGAVALDSVEGRIDGNDAVVDGPTPIN